MVEGTTEEATDEDLTLADVQAAAAAELWAIRQEKAENYREDVLQFTSIARAFDIAKDGHIAKKAELRADCRDTLRTANKFALLPQTELCWIEDLKLELVMLDKERDYVEQVPGLQDDVRQLTLTRIDLLKDAIGVLINAIENQVYTSVDELKSVKALLTKNYRSAKWTMNIRLDADLLLARTNSIILRIGDVMESSEVSPELSSSLLESLSCFATAEGLLADTVKAVQYEDVKEKFGIATDALEDCSIKAKLAGTELEHPTSNPDASTDEDATDELGDEFTHTSAPDGTIVTGPNDFLIHGLEENRFDGELYSNKLEYLTEDGYQVEGPTPSDCDFSELSRKLLSRMPKDSNGNVLCRTSDEFNGSGG